jgi:uncharacterized protein (UPF0332 family)
MTLPPEYQQTAVSLLIEKSTRNMEQAVHNAEMNYWDLVANRLYYSVFHAVNALMLVDGIKTRSHKGTSSEFGRHYILSGIFPKEDGILYSRLQTMREKADYQNIFSLTPTDGMALMTAAQTLQNKIISLIRYKQAN